MKKTKQNKTIPYKGFVICPIGNKFFVQNPNGKDMGDDGYKSLKEAKERIDSWL